MMGSAAAAFALKDNITNECNFVAAEPGEITVFATGERVKIRRWFLIANTEKPARIGFDFS